MTNEHPYKPRIPGIAWAYAGVIGGGLVSIAANVAHSYLPPPHVTDPRWHPETGAIVSAVFWPMTVFLVIEIASRVPAPAGPWWKLSRFGFLSAVGLFAAFVSYGHMNGLLRHYGESTGTARLGPLAVDGLMVMSTVAVFGAQKIRRERRQRPLPAGQPDDPADTPTVMPVPPSARAKHRERHTGSAPVSPPPAAEPVTDGPTRPQPPQFANSTARNAAVWAAAFGPDVDPVDGDTGALTKETVQTVAAKFNISPRTVFRAVRDHKEAATQAIPIITDLPSPARPVQVNGHNPDGPSPRTPHPGAGDVR